MNAKRSRFSRMVKPFFNPRAWMSYDQLRDSTYSIKDRIKTIFTIRKAERTEHFHDAVKRFNLTEAEVTQREKYFFRLSLLMLVITIGTFSYSIYHLISAHFEGAAVSFALGLIGLSLTFRYHFWYFQIKSRRLGCTPKEWWSHGVCGNSRPAGKQSPAKK